MILVFKNILTHLITFTHVVRYINSELDEADREDFFRLKKVQAKKKERTALAEEETRKRNQDQGFGSEDNGRGMDLLDEKDEDVIF